jgi:hypothetical protein
MFQQVCLNFTHIIGGINVCACKKQNLHLFEVARPTGREQWCVSFDLINGNAYSVKIKDTVLCNNCGKYPVYMSSATRKWQLYSHVPSLQCLQ